MVSFTIYEGPKMLGAITCTSWDIRAIKKALKHYFKHYYELDFWIIKNREEGWVEVNFLGRHIHLEEKGGLDEKANRGRETHREGEPRAHRGAGLHFKQAPLGRWVTRR
jgi:hypothetical protein